MKHGVISAKHWSAQCAQYAFRNDTGRQETFGQIFKYIHVVKYKSADLFKQDSSFNEYLMNIRIK